MFLVEVEAEERFIVDVGFLGDVEVGGFLGIEFLGDLGLGVVEFFEEVGLEGVYGLDVVFMDSSGEREGKGQTEMVR